jgi:hypothetical protein
MARCADRLEVRWASGTVQAWTGLEADQFYEIAENQGPAPPRGSRPTERSRPIPP